MDQYHFCKAQHKAEATLLISMKVRQQKLEMTPTGLPSSDVLWRSLRLQLMVTLQRLASERKLTLLEAKEMILQTKPQDLTMEEWCWLESARNLVSIMPPLTEDKVKHYDLSSYPPKLIPCWETQAVPSTSMSTICPLMLISSMANPPTTSMTPHQPPEASTSISLRVVLLSVCDLIRAIFQTDQSPTPNSILPYQLATRHPLSAIPMAPPWVTTRSGDYGRSPPLCPTTPHPSTGQTLCRLGSCRMKELGESTSPSLTDRESSDSLIIFRL